MTTETFIILWGVGVILSILACTVLVWAEISTRRHRVPLIHCEETYGGKPPWERESTVDDEDWDAYEFLGDER